MIPSKRSHLHVAAATHPGMKGKNNEDQFAVSAFRLSADDPTPVVLAIISDGIGGHRAGEIASEMAVETLSRVIARSDGSQPRQTLENAVFETSQKIYQQAEANPLQRGMGATCIIALVIGNRLYAVAVGDSRLYLLRNGTIRQLTTDHTWIQEAIEYGALTPEQARKHPNAHIIRRYLGSPNPPEPDFRLRLSPSETAEQSEANQGLRLVTGDFLVLCSDGLTDLVNEDEILAAFKSLPREKALNHLINLANERGGHDNITIIALEVPGGMEKTRISQAHSPRRKRKLLIGVVLLSLLALLIIGALAVALGVYWYASQPIETPSASSTSIPPPTWTIPAPTLTLTETSKPPTQAPTQPAVTPTTPATLTPWPTNTLAPP